MENIEEDIQSVISDSDTLGQLPSVSLPINSYRVMKPEGYRNVDVSYNTDTPCFPPNDLQVKEASKVVSQQFRNELESGLVYISCGEQDEKSDPNKIALWFNSDYINKHKVYAIKEEKPFLLRVYTHNHESSNRTIRKKGGKKVMLMGEEVFGDTILACGRCGYRSNEGSNVKRHLKVGVCVKERGYSKNDLLGLNRIERRKFLRRIASAKFRAKRKVEGDTCEDVILENSQNHKDSNGIDSGPTNVNSKPDRIDTEFGVVYSNVHNRVSRSKLKKKTHLSKALTLGPVIEQEAVHKIPFDVYTINEKKFRVAWRPKFCHKAPDTTVSEKCHIVFKGARMRRRCLDLPLPIVLAYRKLDCKVHHCNFTLFHPHARKAITEDAIAQCSVNVRIYGDTVMTSEFYHYFISLLSIMKMKSSQTARHLTGVWETILSERLQMNSVPEEHRKIITLSKQTVKSIWANIEEESGKNSVPHRQPKNGKKRRKSVTNENCATDSLQTNVRNQDCQTNIQHPPMLQMSDHPIMQQQQQPQPPNLAPQHPISHPDSFHDQQHCIKRFHPPFSKAIPSQSTSHPLPHPHPHGMIQPTSSWFGHGHQYHNYPPNAPSEDYYSVQASFIAQCTPAAINNSP